MRGAVSQEKPSIIFKKIMVGLLAYAVFFATAFLTAIFLAAVLVVFFAAVFFTAAFLATAFVGATTSSSPDSFSAFVVLVALVLVPSPLGLRSSNSKPTCHLCL